MKNIGTTDRMIRFTFGILLLLFAWWQMSWIALAFAIFTFYEALFSWCIFYQIIGKNSCPIDNEFNVQIKKEESILDPRRLGLAGGILWGLSLFIFTLLSFYTGYAKLWLVRLETLYPGYAISWEGSLIALVYGFIEGALGLFILAWMYNKLRK